MSIKETCIVERYFEIYHALQMSLFVKDSNHCSFDTLILYVCEMHVCYYFSILTIFLSALLADSPKSSTSQSGSQIDNKLQEQHRPINLTLLILKRSCAICAMLLIVFVGVMTREYLVPPMQNINTINETLSTYNVTLNFENTSLSSYPPTLNIINS